MSKKMYKILEISNMILAVMIILSVIISFFITIPQIILLPIQIGFIITGGILVIYKYRKIKDLENKKGE